MLTWMVSSFSDFDYESPWDLPLFKVEKKLRSERFLKFKDDGNKKT